MRQVRPISRKDWMRTSRASSMEKEVFTSRSDGTLARELVGNSFRSFV